MKWGLDRVAAVCGGTATGRGVVTSVVIDSRDAVPGSLFVAVRGEARDGHDFIRDAVDNGATAVMCEHGRLPGGVAGVEVDDTVAALRSLGAARRAELAVPVVAVTGSSGKTTTKDLIAAVLGPGTHAAPRSFNNELGVPLTVLGCPDDATALVVEVGSRGAGHIAALADVVRPDVAVITNVGRAHLEMFGSVAGVREAKWELVESLGPDGIAVLPAADDTLTGRRAGGLVTFGEETGDVRATGVESDATGVSEFDLVHGADRVRVRMPLPGRHQPLNAAAAVAAALAVGRPFVESAVRLEAASVSQWRMEVVTFRVEDGDAVLVNDAYNANPDSMTSALVTVAAMPGRHFAVLGKMHELGESEVVAHRDIGTMAASLGFEVVVVGDDPGIAAGAGEAAIAVADVSAAIDHLSGRVGAGDVVLVKASRAAGLERVARRLQEVFA